MPYSPRSSRQITEPVLRDSRSSVVAGLRVRAVDSSYVPVGVRLAAPNAPPRDYAACLGTAAGSTGPRTAGFVQKEQRRVVAAPPLDRLKWAARRSIYY